VTTTAPRPLRRHPLLLLATTLAAAAVVLSGCSGSDNHALGDSVEIDFYADAGTEPAGSGTIAVTDVRESSTDELVDAGFSLDPDEAAATAYYVDVTFENSSDGAVTPHSPGAEDPDGNLISALTIIDIGDGPDFAPCPGVPDEIAAGQEAEGCAIILVPEGREIERISYHPGGSADFVYWDTE
jgi:hypothetical protein